MSTFISIVVPVYNEERYVERCAEALLAQEYPSDAYEILMVDNNSTDRSAELLGRIPGVKLLHEEIQGDFAARNRGIAEARGEIIAFTDSDTAPRPDWLACIARAFEDPEIAVVVGRLEFDGPSRILRLLEAYEEDKAATIFSGDDPELYFGYTCNLVARRGCFERLGPFAAIQRNADVVFVRKVVDSWGTGAVRYGRDVSVQRLEIASPAAYFQKQAIYGRDYPRYATAAAARPLGTRERLEIFRHVVRHRSLSLPAATLLLGSLVVGALCYDVARWRATRAAEPGEAGA